jgi:hypothetical protein
MLLNSLDPLAEVAEVLQLLKPKHKLKRMLQKKIKMLEKESKKISQLPHHHQLNKNNKWIWEDSLID